MCFDCFHSLVVGQLWLRLSIFVLPVWAFRVVSWLSGWPFVVGRICFENESQYSSRAGDQTWTSNKLTTTKARTTSPMFGRNSASNSNASGSSSNPVPVLTLDNNREHEEEGGPITNYLSFGEHRSSNNDNNHNNNNNNPSSDPTHNVTHTPPRARHQQPVSLVASHEVLLQDQRNLHDNRYRGFSTSMHDMYIATEYERVDCCAMTCGGILQSDRDRFLLQGITPPSIARRFWVHVFFPVSIFALAAVGAMQIPDVTMNQWFTTASILLLLTYLILQCYKGRSKRIEIRKDLLWTKAQLQADRHVRDRKSVV